MNKIIIIINLIIISLTLKASPAPMLSQADEASRKALELTQDNPEEAATQWRLACALYEQASKDPALSNGELYYNLGNAYAQLGNYALAILNYRRAQLFLPGNQQLLANLQDVRAKCQDHFTPPKKSQVLQTLFFWHYTLSFHSRLWTSVVLASAFWLAAFLLLWRRPVWLRITAVFLCLGALAFGGSALASAYSFRHAHPAVIVADETMPRKGDGLSYDHAFDAPIHAGTEVIILRTRGDWHEIALPNRLTGWLPDTDLEAL